jgi:serine/threonine protein phosphatase 1
MANSTFRRTLVVGAIHGAHLALVQVLQRADFDPKQDRLISLGDLTDYNPDSDKVVDVLLEVPHLVAVRGNHDIWAMEWLETRARDHVWLYNGGEETISSFSRRDATTLERYRRFFSRQVPYFLDESNRLYVHAGINHREELEDQSEENLCWSRDLWTLAARSGEMGDPFPENCYQNIFIGHTPTHKYWPDALPKNFGNIWNLDQGAKRSGRLTLMDVGTKEYWQSDWMQDLYV